MAKNKLNSRFNSPNRPNIVQKQSNTNLGLSDNAIQKNINLDSSNLNLPTNPISAPKTNIDITDPRNQQGFAKPNKDFSELGRPSKQKTYSSTKANQAATRTDSQLERNRGNFINKTPLNITDYGFNSQVPTYLEANADIWNFYLRTEYDMWSDFPGGIGPGFAPTYPNPSVIGPDPVILLAEDSYGALFQDDAYGLIIEVSTNKL